MGPGRALKKVTGTTEHTEDSRNPTEGILWYILLIGEAETIEGLKNTERSVKTAVKNSGSRLPFPRALLNVPFPPFSTSHFSAVVRQSLSNEFIKKSK